MRIAIISMFIFLVVNLLFTIYVWNSRMTEESVLSISQRVLNEREEVFVSRFAPSLRRLEEDFGLKPTEPRTLEDFLEAIHRIVEMPDTSPGISIQDNGLPRGDASSEELKSLE